MKYTINYIYEFENIKDIKVTENSIRIIFKDGHKCNVTQIMYRLRHIERIQYISKDGEKIIIPLEREYSLKTITENLTNDTIIVDLN